MCLSDAGKCTPTLAAGNTPAPTKTQTKKKMDLKDIAYGLQTKFEVSCKEQEDLIKAAIAMLYDQQAKNQVIEYHLEWLRDKFDDYCGDDKQAQVIEALQADLQDTISRCHKAEQENAEFRARSNATVVDAAQLAAENNSLRVEIAAFRSEIGALNSQIFRLMDEKSNLSSELRASELRLFQRIKAEGKKEVVS